MELVCMNSYMAGEHVGAKIVYGSCQGSFGNKSTSLQDSPLQRENLKQPRNKLNQNNQGQGVVYMSHRRIFRIFHRRNHEPDHYLQHKKINYI